MGNIDLNIDVDGAQQVEDALTEGLEDGLVETGDWLVREGRETARDHIRNTDRVWRRKLYYAWNTSGASMGSDGRYTRSLRNTAPHARVVEEGLKPGNTPPVQAIIPWVSDNLSPKALGDRQPSTWDPELQQLAAEYTPGMVLTAFAVQRSLEKKGYPGIGFMDAAETYMSRYGPMVLHRKVEKHMERQLRQHGLK
jgi:hypothetical protein